jgi:Cd2+/Zn2+-exporting ATPase
MVNGRSVTVGSHAYFEEAFPHGDGLHDWAKAQEKSGRSTMMLADGTDVLGALSLSDTLRPNAAGIVAELAALGIPVIMLTGDHRVAAETFAGQAQISHVRAELMPEQKLSAIHELQAQFGAVGMVGDGVNDAPALAAASVGIAMGGAGSPQALETADVALMGDDLSALPDAIRLSRFARRIIGQNVVLSFGLKAAFVVLALEGAASLWLAVLADVGMALIVTLNGMRPLRRR